MAGWPVRLASWVKGILESPLVASVSVTPVALSRRPRFNELMIFRNTSSAGLCLSSPILGGGCGDGGRQIQIIGFVKFRHLP